MTNHRPEKLGLQYSRMMKYFSRSFTGQLYICASFLFALGTFAGSVFASDLSVYNSTLVGKHVMGYQGWFSCPADDNAANWRHWFHGRVPAASSIDIDMWPDLSDFAVPELCTTGLLTVNNTSARLYSSNNPQVVDRHFDWMKSYDIDGIALQRFITQIENPSTKIQRDIVLDNVIRAATKHQKSFYIMYDISGASEEKWADQLMADWEELVNKRHIATSPAYWRHNGRPVVAVWGLGFRDRPGQPLPAKSLVDRLKTSFGGATVIGGVPPDWRTSTQGAKQNPLWQDLYKEFDILSPWTVGFYYDDVTAFWYRDNFLIGDLQLTAKQGQGYMPVAFPGYSFGNSSKNPSLFDRIPRRCGDFYWKQVISVAKAGAPMLYTAMFDELNEATAMYKVSSSTADLPSGINFVTLNSKECPISSDWYLRLGGLATKIIRREDSFIALEAFQDASKAIGK